MGLIIVWQCELLFEPEFLCFFIHSRFFPFPQFDLRQRRVDKYAAAPYRGDVGDAVLHAIVTHGEAQTVHSCLSFLSRR